MRRCHAVRLAVFCGTFAIACSSAPKSSGSTASNDTQASGADTEWCHDYLSASDGVTTFSFDYQDDATFQTTGNPAFVNTASPAWMNVWRSTFSGSEQVQGVITVYNSNSEALEDTQGFSYNTTIQVPMTWNGSAFTGQVPSPVPLRFYLSGDDVAQLNVLQFSVVIDGTYLTDPISGSHNFQYIPAAQASDGNCAGETNAPEPPEPNPCASAANGNYCGPTLGQDGYPNTLYVCWGGSVGTTQTCPNGCTGQKCD